MSDPFLPAEAYDVLSLVRKAFLPLAAKMQGFRMISAAAAARKSLAASRDRRFPA
jgi:hypothetical protein